MPKLLKYSPLILLLLVFLCLIVFGMADYELGKVRQLGDYGDYGIDILRGDPAPGSGACSHVGVSVPDNPFTGWPVDYHPGDWNIVTSWFCDPSYFEGYTHWGIDIGRLNWDESIHGIAAAVTTEDAIVERASFCAPPTACFNSGMGNNVMLQALDCKMVCEIDIGEDLNGNGIIDPDYCKEVCIETGWYAYYFHLLDVTVQVGDRVERGDVIGHVDSTGLSTGDHLHYQINGPGVGAIDPAPAMAGSYADVMRYEWKGKR